MDPSAAGDETRVPNCSPTFRCSSGCISHVHHASMFTKIVEGLLDAKLSRGYSFTIICQRHYVFHKRLNRGGEELIHFVRLICRLFGPTN